MKTTEEIRLSDSNNKMSEYINLAKLLLEDAKDTANVTGHHIVCKIVEEIEIVANKAINSDCEYTAYVNCNATEIWFNKIDEQF